ncbi:hypothetical protein SH501x_001634 [Pirellulaceae bacterium SH501]
MEIQFKITEPEAIAFAEQFYRNSPTLASRLLKKHTRRSRPWLHERNT